MDADDWESHMERELEKQRERFEKLLSEKDKEIERLRKVIADIEEWATIYFNEELLKYIKALNPQKERVW